MFIDDFVIESILVENVEEMEEVSEDDFIVVMNVMDWVEVVF